jgi:pimeloyl-ACP methyl ester carboxylesterase
VNATQAAHQPVRVAQLRARMGGEHDIGWEALGDGPPVLLVHGPLSDGSTWRHAAVVASMRARPAVWNALLALADRVVYEIRALDTYAFDADRAAGIEAPTLVATGATTIAERRNPMHVLVKMLPRARLELLDGQGHLAMLTDPAGLAERLHAFLREDNSTEHAARAEP